ncbi:hypothetical protein [Taibaiella soli]|uniref:Lipocalin-like domain-containing protein n=1 Tax=Taibaiella soli TaxID=1649169 RepID=A0A2W2C041_9BACT|nr:hypothetical protein [Taibaiella soli]PZF73433.1 hypothetical protein DN068_08565 [Taibaiella soli]
MKKRILNASAIVLAIAAFSTTSCKKSDDSQSRKDILINGQWAMAQMGPDKNGNNVVDSNEAVPVASINTSANVNFYSDNTYQLNLVVNADTTIFKGNWAFINNDQVLRVVVTNQGPNDTSILNIHNLTQTNLTVLQETDTTGIWEVFTR